MFIIKNRNEYHSQKVRESNWHNDYDDNDNEDTGPLMGSCVHFFKMIWL
jgi:hypothetical protein